MLKRLLVLLVGLAAASGAFAAAADKPAATQWEAGKHYFVIDPPLPTSTPGKVEVLEVFSYACPHCAHFQPYAEEIKASLPSYAQFTYMPAIFQPAWEPFARAYYTAEALGVLDRSHQALFDALHRDHRPIHTMEEIAQFYGEMGADPKNVMSTSASFVIEGKLAKSREMVPKYGVEGTPTLIVNGKYRVTGESAGGYSQQKDLVNYLVKKEHDAKAK